MDGGETNQGFKKFMVLKMDTKVDDRTKTLSVILTNTNLLDGDNRSSMTSWHM